MRRAALVLVVILLLLVLLVMPISMGASMNGMACPDCVLAGPSTACFALLGIATVIWIGLAHQRLAAALMIVSTEDGPRPPERPPK
jgi:hypothetical protein